MVLNVSYPNSSNVNYSHLHCTTNMYCGKTLLDGTCWQLQQLGIALSKYFYLFLLAGKYFVRLNDTFVFHVLNLPSSASVQ